jgi:hypothetical protein
MDRPITNIVAGLVPRGVLIQGPSLPSTFTVENWNPSGSPPAETATEYVFSSVPSQRTSPTLISVIGTLTALILEPIFAALEVVHFNFLRCLSGFAAISCYVRTSCLMSNANRFAKFVHSELANSHVNAPFSKESNFAIEWLRFGKVNAASNRVTLRMEESRHPQIAYTVVARSIRC